LAELEIHQETELAADPTGKRVGVLAALLAVALAIVTIASHRTHTAAIIHKSSANDAWQHYQSTRVKYHNLELGENLARIFGGKGDALDKVLDDFAAQKNKYEQQSKRIQDQANQAGEEAEADEHRALRYDLGEGLLEIALVLSSLYFISRKQMFPAIGLAAGVIGIAIALTGLLP
jgi:hypothetical protein